MTIKKKDSNRAELVKAIIKQNGGKIFTVIAKRKKPKVTITLQEFNEPQKLTQAKYNKLSDALKAQCTIVTDNFMEMTCRTGVKKGLKPREVLGYTCNGNELTIVEYERLDIIERCECEPLYKENSTIKHVDDLISINLTNGKGFRCFSAFNVLELRASGTIIKFKEADVLAFEGE